MTETQLLLLSVVSGQVMPGAIDFINRSISSARLRFLIAMLITLILGVVYNLDNLRFGNAEEFYMTLTILIISSQSAYNLYYKGSKLQNSIRFSTKIPLIP